MLPHFVWADLVDVIADMNSHGFSFDTEWFRPHWEFRSRLRGQWFMTMWNCSFAPRWSPGT